MALTASPAGFDDLVVTASSQGITDAAAIAAIPGSTLVARIEHISGGKCFWHTSGDSGFAISDTGGQGEGVLSVGDVIEVLGQDDIKNWTVILKNGAASATIAIQLYGAGGNH